MELSPDLTRYLFWAGIVAIGAVLAVLDWRWTRRPVFGGLLVIGVASGLIIMRASPFSFAGGTLHGGPARLRRVGTGSCRLCCRLCFCTRLAIRATTLGRTESPVTVAIAAAT